MSGAFPSPGDEIYTNEAGEPTGWGPPPSADTYYCDMCGFSHPDGACDDQYEDEEEDEDERETGHDPDQDPGGHDYRAEARYYVE